MNPQNNMETKATNDWQIGDGVTQWWKIQTSYNGKWSMVCSKRTFYSKSEADEALKIANARNGTITRRIVKVTTDETAPTTIEERIVE